nr:MAG TPA: AAA domain protein [Caudoviricetes sp.]
MRPAPQRWRAGPGTGKSRTTRPREFSSQKRDTRALENWSMRR